MTKFLVDENIPPAIVAFLKDKGFDVKEVHELLIHGASDISIMGLARQEERTLVTFDKHFADILHYPLDSHFGVIRIRIHPPLLSDIIQAFEHFLLKFDIEISRRSVVVLERKGYRVRRT